MVMYGLGNLLLEEGIRLDDVLYFLYQYMGPGLGVLMGGVFYFSQKGTAPTSRLLSSAFGPGLSLLQIAPPLLMMDQAHKLTLTDPGAAGWLWIQILPAFFFLCSLFLFSGPKKAYLFHALAIPLWGANFIWGWLILYGE